MNVDENTPLIQSEAKSDDPRTQPLTEELTGCGATIACDPRHPLHRYLVLILMCFLSFGNTRIDAFYFIR